MIENEITKDDNEELFFCIKSFVDFEKVGLEIEQGEVNTTTTIAKDRVLLKISFPITIKKAEIIQEIADFFVAIDPMRLDVIYDVSRSIIDKQRSLM